MTNPRKTALLVMAWGLALVVMSSLCSKWPPSARAEDNAGAYTKTNAVASGYVADKQTAKFVTLDGTDTVTGWEDPVTKVGSARIFRLRNTSSASLGTKQDLSMTLKFSTAGANATVWVAYYYVDPAIPATYNLIALDQPFGGTVTASAIKDGALFVALTETLDSYGATHCVPIATAISAGTTDVWVGSR